MIIIWLFIWVNYNISLTWIVGPFGDDFPQINHYSRVRENSEVVIKFTQIYRFSSPLASWLFSKEPNIVWNHWPFSDESFLAWFRAEEILYSGWNPWNIGPEGGLWHHPSWVKKPEEQALHPLFGEVCKRRVSDSSDATMKAEGLINVLPKPTVDPRPTQAATN